MGIERIETLLLIAAIVAMVARRLRLPYTVGLVIAGGALALLPVSTGVELTKDLVFKTFLPPLIFEAALYISWQELRKDLLVILVLATLGVLLSAGVTATGMHFIVGWPWQAAILLGTLIAATDPVSVIALFKELNVHGRLRLLVEAESLFNDATAAVLFGIALTIATGGPIATPTVAGTFFVTVIGGIICGGLVAGIVLLISGRTDDHLVEITFTTVAAYGSFLVAEHFGLSGVLATLTTGVVIGNSSSLGSISDRGRVAVESFWEYIAFAANSLVFLLIGVREASISFVHTLALATAGVLLVLGGRAVSVYSCCFLFRRSKLAVPAKTQHVLFWGGLRGALALALVLGLPRSLPHREAVLTVAFAIVAFSVVVQGLTIGPLMKKLGVTPTQREDDRLRSHE